MAKTAILVDGSFYLRMARKHWGDKSPEVRADELHRYCLEHIRAKRDPNEELERRSLYRIFCYDCPPVNGFNIYQPWNKRSGSLSTKSGLGLWKERFMDSLSRKRKVAMRMGSLSYRAARYVPNKEAMKALANGRKSFAELVHEDFELIDMKQEGVDMRIGLDVASLALNGIVDQIVLIAGDSDFIPVVKTARRAGVDFILDPMGHTIHEDMAVQVDAIENLSQVVDIPKSTASKVQEDSYITSH